MEKLEKEISYILESNQPKSRLCFLVRKVAKSYSERVHWGRSVIPFKNKFQCIYEDLTFLRFVSAIFQLFGINQNNSRDLEFFRFLFHTREVYSDSYFICLKLAEKILFIENCLFWTYWWKIGPKISITIPEIPSFIFRRWKIRPNGEVQVGAPTKSLKMLTPNGMRNWQSNWLVETELNLFLYIEIYASKWALQ